MGNLLKFISDYKNAMFVFLGCIVITMTGMVFQKGEYYHYNYERQVIKDCYMGWHEEPEAICNGYKDKEKIIDDKELNVGHIDIPAKVPYDYVMLLGSILQIVFIAMACFQIGIKYKKGFQVAGKDKKKKKENWELLWKFFANFIVIVAMCCLLNFIFVFVNGTFSSNDFLRILFEIFMSLIVMVLGRKLQ